MFGHKKPHTGWLVCMLYECCVPENLRLDTKSLTLGGQFVCCTSITCLPLQTQKVILEASGYTSCLE